VSRSGTRTAKLSIAVALAAAAFALTVAPAALALDATRSDVAAFISGMRERHGFATDTLDSLFAQVESRPAIVEAISRPAEKTMTWAEYRARFITDRRITRGREVARDQAAALDKAAAATGVPASILIGIVGVETFYGEITGKFRVIDALSTLAFDYEPRAEFFRGELEQFLLMSREESLNPLEPLGSYAGAMGIPQFMPTSFRSYAVDGGGDGHRDLWRDWNDVFASVGNYLKVHGWRSGEPVMTAADAAGANLEGLETRKPDLSTTVGALRDRGVKFDCGGLPGDAAAVLIELQGANGLEYRVGFTNFYAITRYNRSALYASAVNDLAEAVQQPAAPETLSPAANETAGALWPSPQPAVTPATPAPPPAPPGAAAADSATAAGATTPAPAEPTSAPAASTPGPESSPASSANPSSEPQSTNPESPPGNQSP
jgi:membrane-bound lytic murein transglycosylase B